jgi:hypothetical protein
MKINTKSILKNSIALAISSPFLLCSQQLFAADWLSLQGLERPKMEKNMKIWGFIQPDFSRTDGTNLKAGPWAGKEAVFNQIAPDNKSNSSFNIRRARVGVRGQLDYNKINYFFLSEFGNNGITRGDGAQLTDASVTFNYVPNLHFRVGQFKTPGSEEGLRAIHVFEYNNFTNPVGQLLLERHLDEDGSRTGATPDVANGLNGPVGAFRDIGIMAFNTFKMGNGLELSLAGMIGNGNGISRGDNDDNKELYLYAATEKVFGGKGPRRKGAKFYGWYQDGKRTLDYANGAAGKQEFDRKRYGVGATYNKGKLRVSGEYIKAEGMIFNGSDGGAVPGTLNNAGTQVASLNILTDDEADGYYLDAGYKVTPKLELDIRYDELNRGTKTSKAERKFNTLTLGAQYFLSKRTRIIANYEFRDAEAPNLPSAAPPNKILDGMDDRLSLQVLTVF